MAKSNPPSQDGQDAADAATDASQDNRQGRKRQGMKRGESKHSPRRIESVERQAEALEYRKLGLSYAQIAQRMEMGSPQAAWNCVESALKRVLQEGADEVRRIELERLDAMWISPYGNACRGDLMALNACLNIMNRRAKLLGLDAPERKELTGKDGKDLPPAAAPIIIIGGAGEEGEPDVMGMPASPPPPAPTGQEQSAEA